MDERYGETIYFNYISGNSPDFSLQSVIYQIYLDFNVVRALVTYFVLWII